MNRFQKDSIIKPSMKTMFAKREVEKYPELILGQLGFLVYSVPCTENTDCCQCNLIHFDTYDLGR